MRKWWLPLMLNLALAAASGWWFREPLLDHWHDLTRRIELGPEIRPDPATYAVLTRELERSRIELAARHRKAGNAAGRQAVEAEARRVLEANLPAMMRCWLGTPWDFHGTAKGPGAGKIACGYFVATVLKDAGFRVDRYQLAQQASENILRSFLAKEACVLTVGEDYQAFAARIGLSAQGVYVVGLDTHVAFLVVDGSGFRFIHSSGSRPWCVVDESRAEAGVLQRSKWRMVGHLTGDRGVIRRWLQGAGIVVRGA